MVLEEIFIIPTILVKKVRLRKTKGPSEGHRTEKLIAEAGFKPRF